MLDVIVDMTALSTSSRNRGIGRYVKSLCRALGTRTDWPGELGRAERELTIAGLVRHHGKLEGAIDPTLQFEGDSGISMTALRYQRHKLERRLFLGSLARRTGARLLHLPDPPGTPMDRRLPRIVSCHDLIPLVMAHDYLSPLPGSRALQRARDRARYATALRVIASSKATKRDLIEQLAVPPERIDVVHLGVDHDRFVPQPEADERRRVNELVGSEQPYLFFLGAGDPRKNLPLLLRAYAQSGVSRDVLLVLGGPLSARQKARLLEDSRVFGVERSVRFLGYVEEFMVTALYRQCLAHVFPSAYEGFGLPILEAMACGAPTLTSTVSSLGEVAGEAALTVGALAEPELAAAITRIVSDQELRLTLRGRGFAQAKRFTWQLCAAETLRCYVRALEEMPA